jgi:hypothetical protein
VKAVDSHLLTLLKKSSQFVVPIYQRVYSWQRPECEQLWSVSESCKEQRDRSNALLPIDDEVGLGGGNGGLILRHVHNRACEMSAKLLMAPGPEDVRCRRPLAGQGQGSMPAPLTLGNRLLRLLTPGTVRVSRRC